MYHSAELLKGKPQHLGCWRRALNCTQLHLFWFPIIPVKEVTRKEKQERCHKDFWSLAASSVFLTVDKNPPKNELTDSYKTAINGRHQC